MAAVGPSEDQGQVTNRSQPLERQAVPPSPDWDLDEEGMKGILGHVAEKNIVFENSPPRPTAFMYPTQQKVKQSFLIHPDHAFPDVVNHFGSRETSSCPDSEQLNTAPVHESGASTSTSSHGHQTINKQSPHRVSSGTYSVSNHSRQMGSSSILNADNTPVKPDNKIHQARPPSHVASQKSSISNGSWGSEQTLENQTLIHEEHLKTIAVPSEPEVPHAVVAPQHREQKMPTPLSTHVSITTIGHREEAQHLPRSSERGDFHLTTAQSEEAPRTASVASYLGTRPLQKQVHQQPVQQQQPDARHERQQRTENGTTQKPLLELMSKGLGNFTEQMAELVIVKLKPEYDTLARKVGEEVKEATNLELKDLRTRVTKTEKMLADVTKERDSLQKRLDKEKSRNAKEIETKETRIQEMEKELEKVKTTVKEKEKGLKKAENKVKTEEQKRLKLQTEHEEHMKEMEKKLDQAKGDVAQQKALRRLASSQTERKDSSLSRRVGPPGRNIPKKIEL